MEASNNKNLGPTAEFHLTTAAAQQEAEPSNVFSEYLQLFERDNQQFCLYLAPNAVLSWFGRNIRGAAKINEFLRYTVNTQYKHDGFSQVTECEPIERTPTQLKTKLPSTSTGYHINPRNIVPKPISLKLYADSADEAEPDDVNDLGLKPLPLAAGEKTPERRTHNTSIEALTPPASGTKANDDFSSATDDEADFKTHKKRPHNTRPATSNARLIKRKRLSPKEMHLLLADSSSDDEPQTTLQLFTPLRYLQAQGVLLRQAQHDNESDVEDFEEEGIKIRLSYRRAVVDGALQFALIVYEREWKLDTKPQPRRDLMSAFNETIEDIKQTVAACPAAPPANEAADEDEDFGEPAFLLNTDTDEPVIATVTEPSTTEIAAALETAAFNIAPMRTPTKTPNTPPPTPKRKPRSTHFMTGLKRLNMSPLSSTPAPKRGAAKSLRL